MFPADPSTSCRSTPRTPDPRPAAHDAPRPALAAARHGLAERLRLTFGRAHGLARGALVTLVEAPLLAGLRGAVRHRPPGRGLHGPLEGVGLEHPSPDARTGAHAGGRGTRVGVRTEVTRAGDSPPRATSVRSPTRRSSASSSSASPPSRTWPGSAPAPGPSRAPAALPGAPLVGSAGPPCSPPLRRKRQDNDRKTVTSVIYSARRPGPATSMRVNASLLPDDIQGDPHAAADAAATRLRELTGAENRISRFCDGLGRQPAVDALGTPEAEFQVTELPGFPRRRSRGTAARSARTRSVTSGPWSSPHPLRRGPRVAPPSRTACVPPSPRAARPSCSRTAAVACARTCAPASRC